MSKSARETTPSQVLWLQVGFLYHQQDRQLRNIS